MTKNLTYEEIDEFQKDFRKLKKRFTSLHEDFCTVKKAAIELFHIKQINNQGVFPIPNFCSEDIWVYKIKKFACKALKGRGIKSGLRVTYAHHRKADKIVFLEIYFKGDKTNEDKDRIKTYLKTFK